MNKTHRVRQAANVAGLLAFLLLARVATAQTPAEAEVEAAFERAPVTLDGRTLFPVRGVSSLPARERAATISARIREAAANPGFEPEQLRVIETPQMAEIHAGQLAIMGVTDMDAEIEGVDRNILAMVQAQAIRNAIAEYREHRRPENLRRGLLTALAATAALAVFLVALAWVTRRLAGVLKRRLEPRIVAIRVQSIQLIPGEQLWGTLVLMARGFRFVLILLAVFLYAQVALKQFPQTRSIGERLGSYLVDPLKTMGRGFIDELPSLLFLLVLFFVVRFLLRLLRLYFTALGSGAIKVGDFDPAWAVPTFRLIRLGVIAFALVVAYPYVPGSSSDAFKGLSIFFGVLLSIGSSSVVANNVAGYALIYRRLFAVGDRVGIDGTVGEVIEMRLQVTRLRTFKNEVVIVPNTTILNSSVINYSALARSRGLILHTTVGIGYETPWRQVEGMLLMAAARTPGLQANPAPFVLQKNLGDFSVTYELNAYTSSADDMAGKYHSLHANILDVFNEYGVQIMTPAYEGDPPHSKVVPKERWYQEPSRPKSLESPPQSSR